MGRKSFSVTHPNRRTFDTSSDITFSGNSHVLSSTSIGSGFKSSSAPFTVQHPVQNFFETDSFPDVFDEIEKDIHQKKLKRKGKKNIEKEKSQDKKNSSEVIIDKSGTQSFDINVTSTDLVIDGKNEKKKSKKVENANPTEKNSSLNNERSNLPSVNPFMNPDSDTIPEKKSKKLKKKSIKLDLNALDSIAEDQNQAFNLLSNASQEQVSLISRAFAGDDVEAKFAEEKNSLLDSLVPIKEDGSMPGWGDWGGQGIVVTVDKKKEEEKMRKRESVIKAEMDKRPDARLKHVIINMKKQKNLTKYTLPTIPYPYKTREEYERSQRHPMGKEWNSHVSHSAIIKPKISIQRGQVIDPIKKTKKMKKEANKRRNL